MQYLSRRLYLGSAVVDDKGSSSTWGQTLLHSDVYPLSCPVPKCGGGSYFWPCFTMELAWAAVFSSDRPVAAVHCFKGQTAQDSKGRLEFCSLLSSLEASPHKAFLSPAVTQSVA